MQKSIQVGIVQQKITSDVAKNIESLILNISNCAKNGAQLVVLQELHNTLYFCQTEDVTNFDLAETIPGNSTELYGNLAKSLGIVLVTSLFEKRAPGI